MALLDTSSLPDSELRGFADQFFARHAARVYEATGDRGVMYVEVNVTDGTALPKYRSQRELSTAVPDPASKLRQLVQSYDPRRESIVAYVAVPEGRVRAMGVVTIQRVS